MATGIRAEVAIDEPDNCPIARISAAEGTSTHSISRCVVPETGAVTEEFMLDATVPVEGEEMTKVFSYGSKCVYRFTRQAGIGCPCERIEGFDCPVVDVYTRDERLFLVFHAPDMGQLQEVIAEVRDRYPGVDVQRLVRSKEDTADSNLVFVDRSRLTARQRECLETAHRMGYFDHPKESNAGEVAEALDITTSTLTEHLAAAQSKIMGAILDS